MRKMSVLREGDELREAERALEQADWDGARRAFEAVLESGDPPRPTRASG